MLEDWKEFTSLVLMTKITKKLSKMREENWKDPWHPPCRAKGKLKRAPRRWMKSRTLHPRRFPRRFMAVQRNLMNPQGKEWNLFSTHKTQRSHCRQRIYFDDSSQFGTQVSSCATSDENLWMQKLQWTRNGKSSRKFQRGKWKKSKARRRLFSKHKETKGESIFLHWWTIVISRTRSWNQKLQKITKAVSYSVVTQ